MTERGVRIYNTLTQAKETLTPPNGQPLGIYVCGPTVYSYVHIGNARTFTMFDVVVRYLRHKGIVVRYVRNYTDVDDKIIQAARASGESPSALADRFVRAFDEDAARLGLLLPDVAPRVTQHMPEIIALIEKLIAAKAAYASGGDVYFYVAAFPGYARLSKRNLDDLRAGERAVSGENKREPLDFALWKAAKPGEPFWSSPWGEGRPGWHIECSAMAEKYLGRPLDIHGGGIDLIFPHHENEIAQSEAASQGAFCRCWMHSQFLNLEDAKMSKSLGNVVRLRDALDRVGGEVLRLFFISTHYRRPLAFTDKSFADVDARLEYFYETLRRADARLEGTTPSGPLEGDPHRHLASFEAAMDDDFNCPGGLAALSGLFNELNEAVERAKGKTAATWLPAVAALRDDARKIGTVLGFFREPPEAWLLARRRRAVQERKLDEAHIEMLMTQRSEARAQKNWAESDRLRDALKAMGVEVMDSPQGSTWRVSPEALAAAKE
ncbi:MAG: cysteine--tRNA ligase [Myxococcaceae bacterium]